MSDPFPACVASTHRQKQFWISGGCTRRSNQWLWFST